MSKPTFVELPDGSRVNLDHVHKVKGVASYGNHRVSLKVEFILAKHSYTEECFFFVGQEKDGEYKSIEEATKAAEDLRDRLAPLA